MLNDRLSKESPSRKATIIKELEVLGKKDPKDTEEKYKAQEAQDLVGGVPRLVLRKSRSENNGLFLFDIKSVPKTMRQVVKVNNVELDFKLVF